MTATTQTKAPAPAERTEHPHIVKSADTLGGEPRVEDTRIPVRQILRMVEAGESAADLVRGFPPLTLAQVYDALSYGYDHPDEMTYYEERQRLRSVMKEHDLLFVDHRLIPRKRFNPADVPADAPVYTWETLPKELDE